MSIQILSLRRYINAQGKDVMTDSQHYGELWRASNITDLFANIETYVDKIPELERFNMFYTVSECEEAKRVFLRQTVIPFDMDDIDTSRCDEYISVFCESLCVEREKIIIVMTGHGLQFLVGINKEIDEPEFFENNKVFYTTICRGIDAKLLAAGLPFGKKGGMDTSCFSVARLFRLPLTKNDKTYKNLPVVDTKLINKTIEPYDINLRELSGVPSVALEDQMHRAVYDALPYIDTVGVQNGCSFLKYYKEHQKEASEPVWYALLSIVARLHDGRKLAHDYSCNHDGYDPFETDNKIDQALSASGPRTCLNISTMFGGCVSCPHWQKVNSPITIRGNEFLATQNDGFWVVERRRNSDEKKYLRPCYEDLVKYFSQLHPFRSLTAASIIWTWEEGFWRDWSKVEIHSFIERNLLPKPNNSICKEFEGKLLRNNPTTQDFFEVLGKINLANGILNYETMELEPHSEKYGFTYKLPFKYDPDAKCPRFEKFLDEIFNGDKELSDTILEYMGYCLSGIPCEVGQKAVILFGDGSNGKSVLLDTLCYLAGDGNFAALSMGNEINKMENRYQLAGKLFNVSEETPTNSMVDSSIFKTLVTGGKVQVRKYYHDAYYIKNRCKIIMACNELPDTTDNTVGMYRRLLIIPFTVEFSHEKKNIDVNLRKKLFDEASGIFNKCLVGLKRFIKNEQFTLGAQAKEVLEVYKDDSDVHSQWLLENLIPDENSVVMCKDFHPAYSFDMKQMDIKSLNNIHLMRKAKKLFPVRAFRRVAEGRQILGYKLKTKENNDNF